MPLYVYTCEDGHQTELFRSIKERHETAYCMEIVSMWDAPTPHNFNRCEKETKLTPAAFTAQVVGGTPKHYPNLL